MAPAVLIATKAGYPISELVSLLYFPTDFSVGGTSCTLDPCKEAVNCKIKHTKKSNCCQILLPITTSHPRRKQKE